MDNKTPEEKMERELDLLMDTMHQIMEDTLAISNAGADIVEWYDENFSEDLKEIEALRLAINKLRINAKSSLSFIEKHQNGTA